MEKLTNSVPTKEVKIMNTNGTAPLNSNTGGSGVRQQQQKATVAKDYRVEHQFLNKMPDINSVENDLMKMLNDFSETRLKKYGKCIDLRYIF